MSNNAIKEHHLKELLLLTKIGSWDLNMKTGEMIYSATWAEILGYKVEELESTTRTWEKMVLPEDLKRVKAEINKHVAGETEIYETEVRMIRKDGTVIWTQDKGKITEYDEEGKPLHFVGVLQDITSIKQVQEKLRQNQETLDLAITIAEMGTWDWHINENIVLCNDEYLKMLGYLRSEFKGTIEEWVEMIHPDDRDRILQTVNNYMTGKSPKLECEMRMRRKDGVYIWTKDMGRIVERDSDGVAIRLVGGRMNVDVIKRSADRISETLGELEHYREFLEKEIEDRTKTLIDQDKMLWAVNDISQGLFSINNEEHIDDVILSALEKYCKATGKDRISLWKNQIIDNEPHCSLLYEFSTLDENSSFGFDFQDMKSEEEVLTLINKLIKELDVDVDQKEILMLLNRSAEQNIPYTKYLPSLHKFFIEKKNVNTLVSNLKGFENLQMHIRGVKAILVTPIIINDKVWGFIGLDNCRHEETFSEAEEKTLSIVGFFLANSIEKRESEKQAREAEERVQLMLDATPLCCNLWTPEFKNMTCNEEAVRLFDLSSQQEYLDRFFELSPEYQPCGRLSSDMAIENITIAFNEGYCKFEWMHQKLDKTPIPSEITLVRVKYKDNYIVSGYTRDLREHNAMLATLQAKEDDLRAARDEALLNSKAKTNFLANMSHEIRTPMNAILGFAEIILRESKDRQNAEHAIGIKNACSNLLNIVNDILDISKIESGKLEIINSEYELSSLLNDVITISQMRLGNKPLMFVTNIDSKLPATLIGDEIRIKQILINILSNAIKFTEEGYISFRVSGEVIGEDAVLEFEVKDTGFGIKDEDLGLLFAEFQRINTTKNRNIEGTGLGLAISKQLCEMMNGEIRVESTFGQGSVFTVKVIQKCPEYMNISKVEGKKTVLIYEQRDIYLRSIVETIENLDCECKICLNQSELNDNLILMNYDSVITSLMYYKKVKSLIQSKGLQTELIVIVDYGENIDDKNIRTMSLPVNCLQIADMLNGRLYNDEFGTYNDVRHMFIAPKAKVLIVDDNIVNLKVASGLMGPYQFCIDTATNGLEAVELIKKEKYDLVFMDHMMPKMDGIDATIEIRKLEGEYFKNLPIVALTANALVGTKEMFIKEGMNDFIAKPIEVGKLAHILAKWIPEKKKILISEDMDSRNISDNLDCEILGINIEQGIRNVGGNKDDYLHILSTFYLDGLSKKSSLLQHFESNDILSFRIEVHALKSTSATIGAFELSKMAAKLEHAAADLNIDYIEYNFEDFILALKTTLDEICPLVNQSITTSEAYRDENSLKQGNINELSNEIERLYTSAEFADIGEIEKILLIFDGFTWQDDVKNYLLLIHSHIAMFDYDGIVECAESLKALIK